MSAAVGDPQAVVRRLLADPPVVHALDFSDEPALGVWSTDPDCYALLASHTRPGSQTLETGAGLSTVLFAALGAAHTCVTPSSDEVDRIRAYCRLRDIDCNRVSFEFGPSAAVLPRLEGPLDVVFIDGSHGFPQPIIDWYYGGSRLVPGGLLVVDDLQLPAVAQLAWVLDRDPRWVVVRRSSKWTAWRRVGGGSLSQDWFEQPWLPAPVPTDLRGLARRGSAALASRLRRLHLFRRLHQFRRLARR